MPTDVKVGWLREHKVSAMGYCLVALTAENAISEVLPRGNSPKFIWIVLLFLLNILEAPCWRFAVLKFYCTTQQVACDFREANAELQHYSHIPVKDIGSNSNQISHHNDSGKGVSLLCWYCQNEKYDVQLTLLGLKYR